MKINVFIDMDGVLAVYDKDIVNKMYSEYFFKNLPVQKGNISLSKKLLADKTLNVFVLSSLISGSPYVLKEKNEWLDKNLPEVKKKHRLFVPEGVAKSDFIKEKYPNIKKEINVLIDDYTVNLLKWKAEGFFSLKMLNGLNNTKGIWLLDNPELYLNYRTNPNHNYKKLTKLISNITKTPQYWGVFVYKYSRGSANWSLSEMYLAVSEPQSMSNEKGFLPSSASALNLLSPI